MKYVKGKSKHQIDVSILRRTSVLFSVALSLIDVAFVEPDLEFIFFLCFLMIFIIMK